VCDRLQPGTIEVFAQRWLARLPVPFGRKDQLAGYWWETSMRQVEVSRTLVFDAPRRARFFFEALIGDNLDIGRPANVEIIFARRIRRDTPGTFRTAIDRPAIGPDADGIVLNVEITVPMGGAPRPCRTHVRIIKGRVAALSDAAVHCPCFAQAADSRW
jgi:hypothetical protein